MHESIKTLIDNVLNETMEFILTIPSFSIEHWKIALPLYSILIASAFIGSRRWKG